MPQFFLPIVIIPFCFSSPFIFEENFFSSGVFCDEKPSRNEERSDQTQTWWHLSGIILRLLNYILYYVLQNTLQLVSASWEEWQSEFSSLLWLSSRRSWFIYRYLFSEWEVRYFLFHPVTDFTTAIFVF